MNAVKKRRIKITLKYTWPLYLISVVLVIFLMNFIFMMAHKTPAYKTLTIFVSGEVTNSKKLKNDLLEKYQEKELKSVSTISAYPTNGHYYSKLTIAGYQSADILIISEDVLKNLDVKAIALEIDDNLKNTYFKNLTLYSKEDKDYGIKLDKEKVKEYMTLTNEDCYMIINETSANIGSYAKDNIKERDNALTLIKDWGM